MKNENHTEAEAAALETWAAATTEAEQAAGCDLFLRAMMETPPPGLEDHAQGIISIMDMIDGKA
mgnify:CR=1 FL=1